MPLLEGHHGERHHLTTAMRTKEFLKFYYPSFVHDHTITFSIRDVDLEGTPPDDLDFLHQLRERAPEEDQMSTFTKACRLHSDRIDASAASTFHQRLVEAGRLDAAAKFLSFQCSKSAFLVFPSGPRSFDTLLSDKEYVAAMRSYFLAPIRRGIQGEAFCRCRPSNAKDLNYHPHLSANCALNGRERTFRHTAVNRLFLRSSCRRRSLELGSLWNQEMQEMPPLVIPTSLS